MGVLVVAERGRTQASLELVEAWKASPVATALASSALLQGPTRTRLLGLGVGWTTAVNLLWPTPTCGSWEPWETALAVEVARGLRVEVFPRMSGAILLGRRVTAAFGFDLPPLATCAVAGVPTISLPHPSGSNRLSRANSWRVREAVDAFLWGDYGVLGESGSGLADLRAAGAEGFF